MKIARREFLKLAGASTLGLYMTTKFGRIQLLHAEAIPGGTLIPNDVPKFATPLLIPPVMPRAGTFGQAGAPAGDYYELSMRQFSQQILPAGLPPTTVWGYGAVKSASAGGLLLHNAPSLTIEAKANRPARIKWINELVDGNGDYLPHLLAGRPDAALGQPARRH
jgi:spore coat protein A, manganese oxidase